MIETRSVVHVIDDDASVRRSLRRLLRSMEFDVETYASAEEFLEVDSPSAGCLLLDVQLPGLSGPQLQEKLAKSHSPMPIIFIAAEENVGVCARAMEAGAKAFLQKPLDDQNLLEALQLALSP